MVEYSKGNLFENLQGKPTVIAHACNAEGRWGSGIAAQFAVDYPGAFESYRTFCNLKAKPGMAHLAWDSGKVQYIGCLITSQGYGQKLDPSSKILAATHSAVWHLLEQLPFNALVYSPKINSGLFGVPWEDTEKVINLLLTQESNVRKNIQWVVWEI